MKHFPLRMHKFAEKASRAALAAAKQDKYIEMSKALFSNYKKLSDASIKKHAQEVGLNMEQFEKDYNDPALKKMIKTDMAQGKSVQVRGVPALFINGRTVKKRSLQDLSKMVEQELKAAK